jgi:hypothetical protein
VLAPGTEIQVPGRTVIVLRAAASGAG